MYKRIFLLSISVLCLCGPALTAAQSDQQSRFDPAAVWEGPGVGRSGDSYRTGSGHPGTNYWQNHVDYTIDAHLDTAAHVIRGTVRYTYTNNSPSPLHSIWLITGRSSSQTGNTAAPPTRPPIQIDDISAKGDGEETVSTHPVGARTQIRLRTPVSARGDTVVFSLDYQVPVSLEGGLPTRMYAPSGVIYEIGYWYPRVAAYSEQHGWAEAPAHRPSDALAEYGSFTYSITVPSTLIVAGSGTLMNPNTVLTSDQRRRLMRARDSKDKVAVITPDQAGAPDTRPKQQGLLTWKYQMNGVRDVAWAASPSFIWNAARYSRKERRDGLAMSYYTRSSMGGQSWNRSTYHTQKAMSFYSKRLVPYPWNTTINVATPAGNRSFPGLSFCSHASAGVRLFSCTVQNLSRNWFPIMLGSNQERHLWLSEGLSTALSVLAHRALYEGEFAPKRDSSYAPNGRSASEGLRNIMSSGTGSSIMTPSDLQPSGQRQALTSYKPAYGLLLLRNYILSPDQFDYALRQYVQRWAYRQPTPQDFFNALEDASGENLDWFWRGWFRRNWRIDQAITDVAYKNDTPSDGAMITLKLMEKMPLPVEATITEADGNTRHLRLPVDIWKQGATHTLHLKTDSRLQKIVLDPNDQLPDIRPDNDTWIPESSQGATNGSS